MLDGNQKRLDRILDREGLVRRLAGPLRATQALAEAAATATVEAQLAQVRRKIGHPVEALTAGPEDLPSVRATLAVLERWLPGGDPDRKSNAAGDLTMVPPTALPRWWS